MREEDEDEEENDEEEEDGSLTLTSASSGAFQTHHVKKDHQEAEERMDVLVGAGGVLAQVSFEGMGQE